MGLFKAIGDAMERVAERDRARQASRVLIEDQVTAHNREHRDDLVLISKARVAPPQTCPSGLYGWESSFDSPLGEPVRMCGRCGRYHLVTAMEAML